MFLRALCVCFSLFDNLASPSSLTAAIPFSSKTADKVRVLASAHQEDTGGQMLDQLLMKMVIDAVQSKSGVDLTKDPRAMAKLRKESRRVKEVLSANNHHHLSVRCFLIWFRESLAPLDHFFFSIFATF